MIRRRDVLIGSACLLAAGAGEVLKPRRLVSLLGPGQLLDHIVPRAFKDWTSRDVGDLFAPRTDDSLMSELYQETVSRIYQQASTGTEIVMLMAHGNVQSNDLQLHRPEVCFPAFGFQILSSRPANIRLGADVGMPARQLFAKSPDHQETIVYWTRLGEYLPVDGTEQRFDRLKIAMQGYVPDGLLARFSIADTDPAMAFTALNDFVPALVRAVQSDERKALIGTERAKLLAAARM